MDSKKNEKNIIVIVGGFRMPSGNASAIRCIGNARLFQTIGFDVVIIGKIEKEKKKDSIWYDYFGFSCLDLECSTKRFDCEISYVKQLSEKFSTKRIFAVVAYNYPGVALNKLRKWCKGNGCYMISDTTEWYALNGKHLLSAILRKLSTEFRMRYVNGKIGNIICSSNYICEYYKNRYPLVNTVLIPMIDEKSFVMSSENTSTALQVHNPRKFIYAGSPGLYFEKDSIKSIVRAFIQLQELPYNMDFYGFSKESYLERFPKDKAVLENNEKIKFHGKVHHDEITKALDEADFYVLYRLDSKVNRVGFSTKAMESAAHGLPLIANDVNGDFAFYFKKDQALISGVNEYDSFVTNIKRAIMMSDEEANDMRRVCKNNNPFCIDKFTDSVRNFMDLLQ